MKPNYLISICLWKEEKLFFGTKGGKFYSNFQYYIIKLINLKDGNIINNLAILKNEIITIKKIIHPKYDECFIFQDINGKINLLKIESINK